MTPRLHLVTNDAVLARADVHDLVEAVLHRCGAHVALHVRGHETRARALHAIAEKLGEAALRSGAWLILNDRVDIAMAARANGVQLGMRSMDVTDARALLGAGARIGRSVHTDTEAAAAAALGADWIFAGSIWETASHPGHEPAGLALLEQCAAKCSVPVIAIGGVTPARIADAAQAGAYGVAVLGGVWNAPDPVHAADAYLDAVREAWQGSEA